MNNIFFFQTQQVPDDTILFDELKKQEIFFSYFQVDQNYYLFVYSQKFIDIDFLYQFIDGIQELDSKQRKIRSFRGFFLYALEIMETGKDYENLTTNLQPFFWKKVKNVIQQNKKGALHEFLFGSPTDTTSAYKGSNSQSDMADIIQTLQNQVNSLQQKIIHLEAKLDNSKYLLSPTIKSSDTLKAEKEDSSIPNASKVNSEVREDSNLLSEASKINEKTLLTPQQYNLSSTQEKGLNEHNFITLKRISEEEGLEIIRRGFQLQNEGKISLKKYYEGGSEANNLFQWKGYSIKYESIRRTKLYQQLKPWIEMS